MSLEICFECDSRGAEIKRLSKDPIEIILCCPECGEQHIDRIKPEQRWDNPPHKTHQCDFCNHCWRPCDRPTEGVGKTKTLGKIADEGGAIFKTYKHQVSAIKTLTAELDNEKWNHGITDTKYKNLQRFSEMYEKSADTEIKRLTTENEAMAEQLNRATEYASRLATTIYKQHYSDVKGWELCDTVAGIISQIDNMTAGIEIKRLTAERDAMREQLREARDNGSNV